MARKNLGKVKRYRRSFYTGHRRIKRFIASAFALIAIFGVGWLVGPAVIDFGTSTWYTLTRGDGQGTSQPQSQAVSEPQPEPTPQPTPPPAESQSGTVIEQGNWAFVSISALRDEAAIASAVSSLVEKNVRYAVLPLKDSQGYVYYPSNVEAAQSSVAATTYDAKAALKALQAAGITPVGSICAFRDPLAPAANRAMAVRYGNTESFWLDAAREAGGKPWLNPYSPEAVGYITDLITEATELGFEQVWLSGVQFPTTAGRQKAGFGDTAGRSMAQQLTALLSDWQQLAVCWVEYPLDVVAAGAANPLTEATPAQLGIKNLVVRLPNETSEETLPLLDDVVNEAVRNNVEHIASIHSEDVALIV